jgi:hypothetical protein
MKLDSKRPPSRAGAMSVNEVPLSRDFRRRRRRRSRSRGSACACRWRCD